MRLFIPFLFLLFSCSGSKSLLQQHKIDPFHFQSQKRIVVKNGAVASAHPLASKIGVAIMKEGGNAFDAAVATQLALAVVYPRAGNLGGGGFMVATLSNGNSLALDYREMAPAAAHRDMYLDENGEVITNKSLYGHLASGIPGTVAGIFEIMQYARLPFNKLIQPAIDLAKNGFVLTASEARSLNSIQADLEKYNTSTTVFHRKESWKEGDTLIQPDLARTLEHIRDNGREGFYEGRTAALVVEEMKKGNGIITLQDMKNYKAVWRTPHSFTYKGHKIISMPLPSSGGLLIHQMLKMVEPYSLHEQVFQSAAAVQLMTEAERRAYADRAEYMGDPDHYDVPVNILTSEIYLKNRMSDYEKGKAGSSQLVKPGRIPRTEKPETTHLSITDSEGNAVAITTTLNNSYGSRTVIGGAGFFMNDEMDDFSAKPGVPNLYGAVGGEANAIAPGKRMLSSMTPTIVLQNDKPFLVIGTPGGTTIPTSVFQTIVNIIDFKLTTEDAVNFPKFHHQWLPDQIDIEKKFPEATRKELERMGYKLKEVSSIGRTEVIRVLPDGSFEAVADIRGDDAAEGY